MERRGRFGRKLDLRSEPGATAGVAFRPRGASKGGARKEFRPKRTKKGAGAPARGRNVIDGLEPTRGGVSLSRSLSPPLTPEVSWTNHHRPYHHVDELPPYETPPSSASSRETSPKEHCPGVVEQLVDCVATTDPRMLQRCLKQGWPIRWVETKRAYFTTYYTTYYTTCYTIIRRRIVQLYYVLNDVYHT